MPFWRNPELVRHVRADLRPGRIVSLAILMGVILTLVGLGCWTSVSPRSLNRVRDFGDTYFTFLIIAQSIVVCVGALFSCLHSIARERELKTLDFLRTTRLASGEILTGKLLGAPIVGYFIFALCTPVTLVAGLLGGRTFGQIVITFLLVLLYALFLGMAGLWMSSLMERQHTGAIIVLFIFLVSIGNSFTRMDGASEPSLFAGFCGVSILPAIFQLYGEGRVTMPTFFGHTVSWIPLCLFLWVSLAAWMALTIIRNVKKELSELRPLSRWQALGFILYVNFLFYAFLNIGALTTSILREQAIMAAFAMNIMALYGMGLATLAPKERLKVWWRQQGQSAVLHENAPGWPWIFGGWAIGLFCLLAATPVLITQEWNAFRFTMAMLSILVFAVRDIMFLQWCQLTSFRNPLRTGFLLLIVYYGAAAILSAFVAIFSQDAVRAVSFLLLPLVGTASVPLTSPPFILGLVLQLAAAIAVTHLILRRLSSANQLVAAQTAA